MLSEHFVLLLYVYGNISYWIAGHCFEKFPLQAGENEKEAWQKMSKSITDKCLLVAKNCKIGLATI